MKNKKSLVTIIFVIGFITITLLLIPLLIVGTNSRLRSKIMEQFGINKTENKNTDDKESLDSNINSELTIFDGDYEYEETETEHPTSTSTESTYTLIKLTVDKDNYVTGTYTQTGHFESTAIEDIVDTKYEYSFEGEIDDENRLVVTVDYTWTSDNNTVEPYHNEIHHTATITITFDDSTATYKEEINGSKAEPNEFKVEKAD
ncbi:hypothetical protein JW887_01160 [Candidatus Dojkabacteria bacterium]|nr:hypothetical protein [Candidatus Dojkabacteria bacterium]